MRANHIYEIAGKHGAGTVTIDLWTDDRGRLALCVEIDKPFERMYRRWYDVGCLSRYSDSDIQGKYDRAVAKYGDEEV